MSTAKAAIVESISRRRLRALPSRKANPAARLEKIKELAGILLDEAESLDHENALAEAAATVGVLEMESGVDFFEAVKRFFSQFTASDASSSDTINCWSDTVSTRSSYRFESIRVCTRYSPATGKV